MLRNQVQLITYPDSLGGSLRDLAKFIDTYLFDAIGGVHILPFYPSSADRGFAPLTHLEVDPSFGSWEDIKVISRQYDLVVDLVINHISCESKYFQDYLKKGDSSEYASMFLEVEAFLSRHEVSLEAFADIYRPRPISPISTYELLDGTAKQVWTTFTDNQIDLNVESPKTLELAVQFIQHLVEQGASLIRLDAIGYAIKRPWTNSFLIPETYEFVHWIRGVTPPEVDLVAEVHFEPSTQQQFLDSGAVEWVYDFSLPLITLHALFAGTNKNLLNWIDIRPVSLITTLDTHDGIGVVDVEGLMTPKEVADVTAWVESNGAKSSLRANGTNIDNVDVYQLNVTYYSALGEDEDAYIVARVIQFFIPGIPQVYYVGLLAGINDYELLAKTNNGRDINRHNYSWPEILIAMNQGVVKRLLWLMKFRSSHTAFNGEFSVLPSNESELILRWELDGLYCQAHINLKEKKVNLEYVDEETREVEVVEV